MYPGRKTVSRDPKTARRSCSVSPLIRAHAREPFAAAPWPLTKQNCMAGLATAATRAHAMT
jgi:hypothetical protein